MNAMQLVDKLREAEYKITHLQMVIDQLSDDPDFKESINVLAEIMNDYKAHYQRTRDTLSQTEINIVDSHHRQ